MKTLLIIIAVFLISFNSKQNPNLYEYTFDYKLEYNVVYPDKPSKNHTVIYYVNSKASNFHASVSTEKRKQSLFFIDFEGKAFKGPVNTKSLNTIEKEGLKAVPFFKYDNPYKYQADNYDFFVKPDTIINGSICKAKLFRSTVPETERQKKLWSKVFYVDTTQVFTPLLVEPTIFENWKRHNQLPNGVIKQIDNYNTKKQLVYSERLTVITPVNFSITVSGE